MTDEPLDDGRYQPKGEIGTGAMARVLRAFDVRLERTVAIKMLHEQLAADKQVVERFRQEGRLAAALAHPNIVSVYDFGEEYGRPYMVMEYVSGQNLRQIVSREAPMSMKQAASIMRQLAAALDFAHANGVIHRDIKPENILVNDRGEVKVGDFGIARALAGAARTQAGTMMGTALYASPEQFSGKPVTAESDLYSAGVVLYELLTAHVPFPGENSVAVGMGHVSQVPPPPSSFVPTVPRQVDAVVLKALAKDPADRFHSGYELVKALQQAATASWTQSDAPPAVATGRGARAASDDPAARNTVIAPNAAAGFIPQRRSGSRRLPVLWLLCLVILAGAALAYRSHTGGGSPSLSQAVATATALPAPTQVASGPIGGSHGATIALVTAQGVDANFLPVGVTSRFAAGGGNVYAVATVRDKASGDTVRFTWHYPNGTSSVYDNTIVAQYSGTVIAYAELAPAAAGSYSVTTAINGQNLASASFTVTG
jgi:serine/threonine-protein kinase